MTPGQDTSFSSREAFGPKFGDQDTIGCGINFQTHTVFYTHNGRVVGKWPNYFTLYSTSLSYQL